MTATKQAQARLFLRTFMSERISVEIDSHRDPVLRPTFRVIATGVMVLPNGDEIPVKTTLTSSEMQELAEVADRVTQRYLSELASALFPRGGIVE